MACATVETVAPLLVDDEAELVIACGTGAWQVARAYARIKALHERRQAARLRIVYRPAPSIASALAAHARLERAASQHLGVKVDYGGTVVDEPALRRARERGLSLFGIDADCEAARVLQDIARAPAPAPRDGHRTAALASHPAGIPLQAPSHVHRPRHA